MTVRIIYCHPSDDSLTRELLDSFIEGLAEAGHEADVCDLYRSGFNPLLSEAEYRREAWYDGSLSVPPDVALQQEAINRSDGLAFVFPLFWTDVPALLKGWFDRVWTWGFAYGSSPLPGTKQSAAQTNAGRRGMKTLKRALYLCSAGNPLSVLEKTGKTEALGKIWLDDRINDRAETSGFIVFGGTSRELESRESLRDAHLEQARKAGREFFQAQ
ncbi:MAG: NAD(P)H-dependent oxidoreductase [Spirochaetales bacterium]|nr:NAD(P)H-dependent oxidoreductase [Spirochaetales bacterium]